MAQTIEKALTDIFSEYLHLADEVVEKASRKTARDTVQTLRNTSPGIGSYHTGWTTKKKGLGTVVYNKTDYQLTHLLEKSHVIRNKYGEYGRSTPQVHIAPAAEEGAREFEQNIRRELSK